MKNQVNSRKISSFPNIPNHKFFGNLWGNAYGQFLVIILCFTFPLFHGLFLQLNPWGVKGASHQPTFYRPIYPVDEGNEDVVFV